ncbi:MAG: hypothetical protein KAY37_00875 [Phycisphaerae bacterium]|nr:hypothetical protein [Phycisphaerae bacterium]
MEKSTRKSRPRARRKSTQRGPPGGAARGDPPTIKRLSRQKRQETLDVAVAVVLGHFEQLKPAHLYELLARLTERIPQKLIRHLSGKQTKTLNEQADKYQLAIGGPSLALGDLLRSLFALLNRISPYYSKWLGARPDGDPLLNGPVTPMLELCREEIWRINKLKREEMESRLIPRDQVHEQLARLARLLRSAGEALEREHGPAAREILSETLEDWERELHE